MNRILGYALAMAVGLGTGAALSNGVSANTVAANHVAIKHGTDAAFHDGLYMGKHDAEEGRLRHVSAGRWSTATDRSQYQAGYDAGFSASIR